MTPATLQKTARRTGAITLTTLALCGTAHAQGVYFRGIGAVNESMGGTAIAAPLDSSGAIYANPATLSALTENEISLGMGALIPKLSTKSKINIIPATEATSYAKSMVHLAPTFSIAYRNEKDSPWTFGLLSAAVGGAAAEYASTGSQMVNPILQGHTREAEVKVVQILPTVSFQANEQLSFGASAVGGIVAIMVNPLPFGQTPATPLMQSEKEYTLGYGANFGVYYDFKNGFRAGATVKTPMWAPAIKFNGASSTPGNQGQFVSENFELNLPLVLGIGVSYDGLENWLFALDLKYFDYAHTTGFKDVIQPGGTTVAGLGWSSVGSISLGVQYELTEDLKLRAGYCFNENPIPPAVQYANVTCPLFIQHVFSLGATYTIEQFDFTIAWAHAFAHGKTGSFQTPAGPGTVTNTVRADEFFASITRRF